MELGISDRGYWLGEYGEHHFDRGLAGGIRSFLVDRGCESILDLGCGLGEYTKYLRGDFNCDGYDGNPDTHDLTDGVCSTCDFSYDHKFKTKYDWVMSLEVGEHIPEEYESIFINNLHQNNRFGIILSWAEVGQPGYGHVNCRSNEYIQGKISDLGYEFDNDNSIKLRNLSELWWFKNTIMVFIKQ